MLAISHFFYIILDNADGLLHFLSNYDIGSLINLFTHAYRSLRACFFVNNYKILVCALKPKNDQIDKPIYK